MIKAVERNDRVTNEINLLINKLGWGSMDLSVDVHGKRITALTVFGKKRNVYQKENQIKAYEDIIRRIKQSSDNKENSKLTFVVDMKAGIIDDVTWHSQIRRNYEELDSVVK